MKTRAVLRGLACAVAALTLAAGQARADIDIFYVDDTASGANNGTCWTDAYESLQIAINPSTNESLDAGDQIRVAQGTYLPGMSPAATFSLPDEVSVLGGFAGDGAPDPDDRDIAAYPTTLSGAGNNYHVVTAGSSVTTATLLEGFVISGGLANGPFPSDQGGGLYVNGGSPTVRQCRFEGNDARLGGGMYIGGGSQPYIDQCVFEANTAQFGAGGFVSGSMAATIVNSEFVANQAVQETGGLHLTAGGNPVVLGCLFLGNSCTAGPGGAMHVGGTAAVTNCVFSGNTSTGSGGGMYLLAGSPTVSNCTFAANSADSGGAVYAASGGTGTGNYRNCIFWSNGTNPLVEASNQIVVSSSNVAMANVDDPPSIFEDPQFVRDPDPGNNDYGDLSLSAGSPLIDEGVNASISTPEDIAGNPRIVAGSCTGPAIVDQGAYEFQSPTSAPPEPTLIVEAITDGIGSSLVVVPIDATAADPDDATASLNYDISVNGVSVSSGTCSGPDPDCASVDVELDYGTYDVTLSVADGCGDPVMDQMTINVVPTDLSVFDADKVEVKFGDDPVRFKASGQIGLPFGVDYSELIAIAELGLDVGGASALDPSLAVCMDPSLVCVAFEISGGQGQKWTYREDDAGPRSITKLDIDWKGARYRFKDFGIELKSDIITTAETVLELKYKMNEIGGAFSIDIGGLATVEVAADGGIVEEAIVTVEKPGKEALLTLPFPLTDETQITLAGDPGGPFDPPVEFLVGDDLRSSVGRYRLEALLDPADYPDGVATTPREVALSIAVGAIGYPGTLSLDETALEIKGDKWKAD